MTVTLPRTMHKMDAPYHLLWEGENGSQLWERLGALPYEFERERCFGFTLLTAGTPSRAMVLMWEAGGLRAYQAICVAKDRTNVVLEVGS